MKNKGLNFSIGETKEWLDCGNKNAVLETQEKILKSGKSSCFNAKIKENSNIIPPCYIGKNVEIYNSTIGPFVSIGDNTVIAGQTGIAGSVCIGKNVMIGALSKSPLTAKKIFEWRAKLESNEMLVREIIDIDSSYVDIESDETSAVTKGKLKNKKEDEDKSEKLTKDKKEKSDEKENEDKDKEKENE